ncbi:MAG: hypothetical protein LUG95_01690 [Clostridiales bacterium]|nr:hypothetical protein [Clostridiales bacterium]
MLKKRYFAVFLAAVMAFSSVTVSQLASADSVITAYAASVSAPKVKASNASYNSVKLKWKKVKGAQKYIIMRSTKKKSGYKAIKTVKKASYNRQEAHLRQDLLL